jgi:uncharacterized protein (UPF0335 family)
MTDDVKHNSVSGVAATQLRAYVERIERLQTEQDDLGKDKGEVYAEAKSAGFDKKTIRKVVRRRQKNQTDREEEDAMLDLYEAAIAILDSEHDPLE